jgi:hypothetical protein
MFGCIRNVLFNKCKYSWNDVNIQSKQQLLNVQDEQMTVSISSWITGYI